MLPQTTALLFFVAEELPDRKPFERFLEFALMCRNHTRKRGRQLGAQCDFAFALVNKIKKLIDDFLATLFLVELSRLEQRAFPFDKPIATGNFAPASKDVISRRAVLGKKIAKTG